MLKLIAEWLGIAPAHHNRSQSGGMGAVPGPTSTRSGTEDRIVLETRQTFAVRVVAASYYQPALQALAGKGELDATMRQERDSSFDPNAIQVLVGNKVVGYLSREDAAYFTEWIVARRYEGRTFKAPAMVEYVTFDEGEAHLYMIRLRILFGPPHVVGDLAGQTRHAIDLVNRQDGPRCIAHMDRVKREAGAVSLDHLAADGFALQAPCAICSKPGYTLTAEGFRAKFGRDREYVEAHSDCPTVSGWEM